MKFIIWFGQYNFVLGLDYCLFFCVRCCSLVFIKPLALWFKLEGNCFGGVGKCREKKKKKLDLVQIQILVFGELLGYIWVLKFMRVPPTPFLCFQKFDLVNLFLSTHERRLLPKTM